MKTCKKCNKQIDGTFGSGIFCSRRCANSRKFSKHAIQKKRIASVGNIPWNKGKRKLKTIPLCKCGNAAKSVWSVFCSQECRKQFAVKRPRKLNSNCINCTNPVKQFRSKYCSTTCYSEATLRNKTARELYKKQCKFDFSISEYPELFDSKLINTLGWYHPVNNPNGVSRDHRVSITEGFKLGVDPSIIRHPLNCELMPHTQNQRKKTKSSVTIQSLLDAINQFKISHLRRRTGIGICVLSRHL